MTPDLMEEGTRRMQAVAVKAAQDTESGGRKAGELGRAEASAEAVMRLAIKN